MAKRRTLLVFEKPMQFDIVAPHWQAQHPDDEISLFYTPPMGSFRFRLPRDLPLGDVPIIQPLALEPRKWRPCDDGRPSVFDRDFADLARRADHIVCATDPDPQGARNFLDLLRFHHISTPLDQITWLPLWSLTGEDVQAMIAQDARVDHPDFARLAAFGHAKQYFDHLFLLNALPVFGKTLHVAGFEVAEHLGPLSKFTLQTLLLLARESQALTDGEMLLLMRDNPASKRKSRIGSPISMAAIIEWLKASECIEKHGQTGQGRTRYGVSSRGRRLVRLLHKDCFDPDLAARIDSWGETWPASKSQIERYIRTFFGKQKRFLEAQISKRGY